MPLELLPLEEADLWAYRTIFAEAFENTLMAVMFPNGYTEEDKTIDIEFQAREWLDHPEEVKLMKVIDTDLPDDDACRKIVGVSKWKFYPNGTTEEKFKEGDEALLKRTWPPNADVQMFQAFIGAVRSTNREILGLEPYAALGVLATRPTCHRRGVGAMHMKWGVAEADKLGLRTYIEASPMGRPLYERFGFETVKPLPFDFQQWGLTFDLTHSCMLRPGRDAVDVAAS